jgi:hypothetical protein
MRFLLQDFFRDRFDLPLPLSEDLYFSFAASDEL